MSLLTELENLFYYGFYKYASPTGFKKIICVLIPFFARLNFSSVFNSCFIPG
jgi:hypothetical protein